MMQFFDTHANSKISVRLNASLLSVSSIDTLVNYDLDTSNDMNTSNDIKLNVTILNEHTYSMSTHYQLKWFVSMCAAFSQNCAIQILKNFASHMTLSV